MPQFKELKITIRGGSEALGRDEETAAVEIKRIVLAAIEKVEHLLRRKQSPYALPNTTSTKWNTLEDINGNNVGVIELSTSYESEE